MYIDIEFMPYLSIVTYFEMLSTSTQTGIWQISALQILQQLFPAEIVNFLHIGIYIKVHIMQFVAIIVFRWQQLF